MSKNTDFWDAITAGDFVSGSFNGTHDDYLGGEDGPSSFDEAMARMQERGSLVQNLTDHGRELQALALPATAGTRVALKYNTGSVLAYTDVPDRGVGGTVVTVRTSSGDLTSYGGGVFVAWDDGVFRTIHAEHLQEAPADHAVRVAGPNPVRRVVNGFGDLSDFFKVAGHDGDLVHKATKDLWSVQKEGNQYAIVRLFKDDGQPLKV